MSARKPDCRVRGIEAVELCGAGGQIFSEFRQPPLRDHRRIRRSDCSWRAFHDVAFYCCDLSPARMCQGRQGRTAQEGFTRDREEHLRRPIHGPLSSCKVSGADGRPCGIRFRPNRFGRSFGRKLGVLYDDYVKNRFVSGCAINKIDEEVVLHTQEVTGSSPVAPTIHSKSLMRNDPIERIRHLSGIITEDWPVRLSARPPESKPGVCPTARG